MYLKFWTLQNIFEKNQTFFDIYRISEKRYWVLKKRDAKC